MKSACGAQKVVDVAIACVRDSLAFMQAPRTDLAEMLASMPELQALLKAEREAAHHEREAAAARPAAGHFFVKPK